MTTNHTTPPRRLPLADLTDVELVECYRRDRDPDAFAELVGRWQRVLWSTAVGIVRNPDDASEVVQTAWVNALRALARPDGFAGRSAVSTWLQTIVRHEALNRLRRNRVHGHQALDPDVDPADVEDAHAAADARIVLAQLLDVLNCDQRAAIELVWLRGLSVAETALVLDVAPGTVKSRCGRARHLMAAAVGRAGLITTTLHDQHDHPA